MTTAALISADFRLPPFAHQFRDFEENAERHAIAKAWHMRTGKTKSEIDRACHLYRAGKINGVLIFAPKGVHRNWVEVEWPAHVWDNVPSVALGWYASELSAKAGNKIAQARRAGWHLERDSWLATLKSAKTDSRLMVLAINDESMIRKDVRKILAYFIKHRKLLCIFDESDDFGIPGSKRTKMARSLARRCAYRSILSGTLVTASPLAAFSQYELLEKGALGFERFQDFKDRYANYVTKTTRAGRNYPALVGFKNLDELRERMAKFTSVVLREDCHDMPDLIRETLLVKPTPEQLRVYRELHKTFMVDIAANRVSVGERAPRFQKLQQVFSGFVIDEFGKVRPIPGGNPRLDLLSEQVELAPGKVIIWCQFQADIDSVKLRLERDGHSIVEYHGRVSDKLKLNALREFRQNGSVKALVGHPKSGGRGLDFSIASAVFWYSHTFSARIRAQAMERATKVGGKNIRIVDFRAPGPDVRILATIDDRIDIANMLAGQGMKNFLQGIAL